MRKALGPFGRVAEGVERKSWREDGFSGVELTTRRVRPTLRDGMTTYRLPHQLRTLNDNALVIVPCRAPMYLRCRKTGHVRRDCRVPRCNSCRRFRHFTEDCVRTYASVTGGTREDPSLDLMVDDEEAEVTVGETKPSTAGPRQWHDFKSAGQAGTSSCSPGQLQKQSPRPPLRRKAKYRTPTKARCCRTAR
ncbi:hypothetical protein ANAPC5_01239 [Anaplasma phagocytophilum]|nr:hypothetical protein ANAPC5_01239 [Anaplasma phagocytophilum]